MSYSENIAKVVADQLNRFVTLNRHQLAAQVANLDFWLAEALHALAVIDGYEPRFRRLKAAQDEYVAKRQTVTFFPDDPDLRGPPGPPTRIPGAALAEARRAVTEGWYQFLVRLTNDGLIPESRMRECCDALDIGIDAADLKSKRSPPSEIS